MAKGKKSFMHDWEQIDTDIMRHRNNGQLGESGVVVLDPLYDPKNQDFIYKFRGNTKKPLVAAYGSEVLVPEKVTKQEKKKKSDPYTHMIAITERIPHRLSNAPQLSYPESLYVLDRSLEGYEEAYKKCGPMKVTDRMIGFNTEGRCKVWVNENFTNNHPSHPRRILQSTLEDNRAFLDGKHDWPVSRDESEMVHDVVDAVENHCEEGLFRKPFGAQIRAEDMSFSEARRLIHQTAINEHLLIPDRVDLVHNLVRTYRTTSTHVRPEVLPVRPQILPVRPEVIPVRPVTPPPVYRPQPTTSTQGYRFNYIPPEEPFHPDVFTSHPGEHGVHHGHHY